ncbi:unnamed protein product [Microthlaspi erraticum]|uniref:Uncharacterized protein n=1 Tax=Microthlaspi erraticum TaxID=1685480 RepID=A0A6D2HP73_9BRAS|nr:unnamed protein product [Microthlaspi erraticum]
MGRTITLFGPNQHPSLTIRVEAPSSFEPREGEDNSQRRRKSSNSTIGLDRVQTEETQLDRAEGRADQEEPQFEDPGFEYDQAPGASPGLSPEQLVYANSIESVNRRLGRARLSQRVERGFRGHRGYKRNLRCLLLIQWMYQRGMETLWAMDSVELGKLDRLV